MFSQKIKILAIFITFVVLTMTMFACDCASKETKDVKNGYAVNVVVDGILVKTYYSSQENGYEIILPYKAGEVVYQDNCTKYFYGWYGDSNFSTAISSVGTFKSDCSVFGKWCVTDNSAFSVTEENGDVTITAFNGTESEIFVVPETINGKTVKKIGDLAFKDKTKIQKVILPSSVTEIGDEAFSGCTSLMEIRYSEAMLNVNINSLPSHMVYTITYDADGGTLAVNPEKYSVYSRSFEISNPTREGYNFLGWSGTGIDGLSLSVIVQKGEKGNREYKANWERTVFNISYNYGADTIMSENPSTYDKYGQSVTLVNPVREGYDFVGWSLGESEQLISEAIIEQGTCEDLTFTANWKPTEYNIIYNMSNGAVNGENNPDKYTIESDTITLENPSREHYQFVRWELEGEELNTIISGSTGDKQFTAVWQTIEYKVNYNLAGGVNHQNNPSVRTVESKNLVLLNPTRTGYEFCGWSDGQDIIAEVPAGGNEITLTAKWTAINYLITYELDGGNLVNAISDYTIESSDIVLSSPTKDHYDFTGWSSTPTGNGQLNATINSGSFGDKTFYAKWTPKAYAINYNLNGGTNFENAQNFYTIESADIVLGVPTKDGYDFDCWLDDNNNPISKIPAGSFGAKNFKAIWKPITYNINYEGMEHAHFKIDYPKTFNVESEDVVLVNPERVGYVFKEWKLSGEPISKIISGSIGDKTLIAVWENIFVIDDGVISNLSDYGKTLKEIYVPDKIDGENVSVIAGETFYVNTTIEKVTIAKGIESIEKSAFNGCINLKTVEFESDSMLTEIKDFAFSDCNLLQTIVIPKNVSLIGKAVFGGCTSLTCLKFENPSGWKGLLVGEETDEIINDYSFFDDEDNATKLKGEYVDYSWSKQQ